MQTWNAYTGRRTPEGYETTRPATFAPLRRSELNAIRRYENHSMDSYPLPDGATNRGRLNNMTANKAASEIRHKIIRKMKTLDRKKDRWFLLYEYIDSMAKRASKKKGGLGRK